MKKNKALQFDAVMDIYDEVSIKGKETRPDYSSAIASKTVAEKLKEAIRLSEQLIWKRPLEK